MKVIRIKTHLDSDTVHLPELKPLLGRDVEMLVWEEGQRALGPRLPGGAGRESLRGSVLRDDDPFGPAASPEEWEAAS